MTRAELIDVLANKHQHLPLSAIEDVVKFLFEYMATTLEQGGRIEIRGFGSFEVRYRAPRKARNPKTGEAIDIPASKIPDFKAGKNLKETVQ